MSEVFGDRPPFKMGKKWRDTLDCGCKGPLRITYSAGFWYGPTTEDDPGFYKRIELTDVAINGSWLNTSKTVGYYNSMPTAPNDNGIKCPVHQKEEDD